ncbi:MAG: hypothetical protein EOM20_03295 [Spartobacteria bacterium]|nr:hypothetical protein [Spartobacteria bacterium]
MKKTMMIMFASLAAAGLCLAGMSTVGGGVFNGTGANASATIAPAGGAIVLKSVSYDFDGSATYERMFPSVKGVAAAAASASTNLSVETDSTKYVGSFLPAANDYLFVANDTAGWQKAKVLVLGSIATNAAGTVYTTLQLDTAVTAAADDAVWFADAVDDVLSSSVTDGSADREWQGMGGFNAPVWVGLTATSTVSYVSGMYEIWD